MFATGGQRPEQLLRAKWSDYDFDNKTLTILNYKRNGSVFRHVVPLSERALKILRTIPEFGEYPFTYLAGKHIATTTLSICLNRFQDYHGKDENHYLPRDIRRTCKNLLIDAGVNREGRNLLQCHQLTGVDFKHYDRHEHLPEKWAAMEKYDRVLADIIGE